MSRAVVRASGMTSVDDPDRKCLKCGDQCPGFVPHFWRSVPSPLSLICRTGIIVAFAYHETRQAVHIVDSSRNHCCCGKEISITYSVCVCVCVRVIVALLNQHTKLLRPLISIASLSVFTIFFSLYLLNGTSLGDKN
jgi:hypothetical protein